MKVAVALSGGVDSFVAALILKEEGHEVFGIYMRVSDDPHGIEAARRAAQSLGIEHHVLDLRGEFQGLVVEPFVRSYLEGRTPNPCVLCNERIKFRLLKDFALGLGAEAFATGHYVKKGIWGAKDALWRGRDLRRDQSYFLWRLTQEHLQRVVFPLGDHVKERVKAIASSWGYPPSGESREICFIKGDYRRFLEDKLGGEVRPGPIVDKEGRVLGWHTGVYRFTIGQRHGLGLKASRPYYVIKIEGDAIVVGSEQDLYSRRLRAEGANWIAGEPPGDEFLALGQIRYRHQAAPCKVRVQGEEIYCEFSEPQRAITPGQALVLYDGHRLLGGGWITEVLG